MNLSEIYNDIWKHLEEAVRSRNAPWHLVTLATLRGNRPEIRTLVLRGVSSVDSLIWMHTDLRSPKCQDIKDNQEGALLFYDAQKRWQLRLNGSLSFDSSSPSTESVWHRTSASAKRCYQGELSPSSLTQELNSNLPKEPTPSELGRENFTRLLFKISKLDWLFLRADGHVRAQWILTSQGFNGSWLIP
jgi:general stress protein 26